MPGRVAGSLLTLGPCPIAPSSDSESGSQAPCDQLVSPTALAACTRVDSCFAPSFVPSVGVSVQLAQVELHLCHHLDQLGTGTTRHSAHRWRSEEAVSPSIYSILCECLSSLAQPLRGACGPSCQTGSCHRSRSTWWGWRGSRGRSRGSGAPVGAALRSSTSGPSWTAVCWSTVT